MQTFLPYADFQKTAKCLDDKRLGKQRVECLQILKAIYIPDYGWRHHPAVNMWKDYPHALQSYMNTCIREWIDRGFKNTMAIEKLDRFIELPQWLGNATLHASHRSNLLRKDKQFYSKFKWKENDCMPYYWCGFSKQDNDNYQQENNNDNQ